MIGINTAAAPITAGIHRVWVVISLRTSEMSSRTSETSVALLGRRLEVAQGMVEGHDANARSEYPPRQVIDARVDAAVQTGDPRLVGGVIAIKENAYFQAAEAIGASRSRTLIWHVVPNIVAPVIIAFSINIGAVIISEASLSFLGFGLPVDIPSWGGLLSREGRQYMEQAPWLAFWPGIFLTVLVYSLNMFGDAVRDLLDPRLRGGGGRLGREPAKKASWKS